MGNIYSSRGRVIGVCFYFGLVAIICFAPLDQHGDIFLADKNTLSLTLHTSDPKLALSLNLIVLIAMFTELFQDVGNFVFNASNLCRGILPFVIGLPNIILYTQLSQYTGGVAATYICSSYFQRLSVFGSCLFYVYDQYDFVNITSNAVVVHFTGICYCVGMILAEYSFTCFHQCTSLKVSSIVSITIAYVSFAYLCYTWCISLLRKYEYEFENINGQEFSMSLYWLAWTVLEVALITIDYGYDAADLPHSSPTCIAAKWYAQLGFIAVCTVIHGRKANLMVRR